LLGQILSRVEIDAWLRGGGVVVTASERSARSLISAFHRARRGEGLAAWPAPNVQDWQSFIHLTWRERAADNRLVLNLPQEQSLWAGIIAAAEPVAARLEGTCNRLAGLAMEAHRLLCAYTPDLLNERRRDAWDQDAAAFSSWLTTFDQACRSGNLISAARLPLEIIAALKTDTSARPPLLLAGFDRILPTQREFFSAWGECKEVPAGSHAPQITFHRASDPASELAACALWCQQQVASNPRARLIVVTQDAATRRAEIERAFLRYISATSPSVRPAILYEFSLGVKLSQIGLARSASLLLHWLNGSIAEQELDWLLTSSFGAAPSELTPLTAFVRAIRHRNQQRTRWSLTDFLRQRPGAELPAAWLARMTRAQRRLLDFARNPHPPIEWAQFVPQLLKEIEWPDGRSLTSAEFQAHRRWQQTVDDCASLGFDGRRINWNEFLAVLDRAVDETLFAPESEDAPILIAGPAETAGLTADALWFMGTDEDAWPGSGSTHPLVPLANQRQAEMPHATAQLDWNLAEIMTRRLVASAREVHFSYARQKDGVDMRPSRLIVQLAGAPTPVPPELTPPANAAPLTIEFQDTTQLPFPPGDAPGGAATLTAQSQCAFKSFATARLNANDWELAEAGLTALERGQLVHEVLHSIWAGPPVGIRSHAELVAITDLDSFVERHVRLALQNRLPRRARECMPHGYLALEETRLSNLVTEWLRYESVRVPFTVVDTEKETDVSIAGIALHLRLDRIDRLNDNTLLVIDYKTGNVSPGSWDLPRPDDVQLPLYAGFAIDAGEELGGFVFAKLRAGERNREFAGRLRNARGALLSDLNGARSLVRRPLTDEELREWRGYISQLARDFLAGRAGVDPREYPETCERCRLQGLCRVYENPPVDAEEAGSDEEAGDA
jgi:probable DNA repair protein